MSDSQPSAYGPQPLQGLRVLVTRAEGKGDGMAARLRELGAMPFVHPTIAYAPPEDEAALEVALARLEAGVYEWLLLTSVRAVEAVAGGLAGRAPQLGNRVSLRIGAVGPATAAASRALLGAEPAAVPERFLGAELAQALGELVGRRVLLPNADIARPELEQHLLAGGALVERVVAYRTVPAPGGPELAALLEAGGLDVLLFTSPSTARFFVLQIGPAVLEAARRLVVACIGPATAEGCRESGLEPTIVAEVSSEAGLLDALIAFVRNRPEL